MAIPKAKVGTWGGSQCHSGTVRWDSRRKHLHDRLD